MHPLELLVVGGTGLLAAYVSGVAGIGLSIVLLPVLVLYMGVREAIPILAITLLAAGLSRVGVTWRHIAWPVVGWSWLGALPGAAVGAYLFTVAPTALLTRGLGGLLLVLLVWRHIPRRQLTLRRPQWFLPIGAGFGVLSGVAAGVGPLIAPFYLAAGLRKGAYVGTAAAVGLGMQAVKLAVFGSTAVLTPEVIAFGLFLIPISVVGTVLGKRTLDRVPERVFVLIIEAVMLLGGITLLLRG
ncbi:MAG TPA: sulfite exporter TauE/SafE family protein [bacterium]|nr:sulfite exporter TauE/SafE family protein [bacterium]